MDFVVLYNQSFDNGIMMSNLQSSQM